MSRWRDRMKSGELNRHHQICPCKFILNIEMKSGCVGCDDSLHDTLLFVQAGAKAPGTWLIRRLECFCKGFRWTSALRGFSVKADSQESTTLPTFALWTYRAKSGPSVCNIRKPYFETAYQTFCRSPAISSYCNLRHDCCRRGLPINFSIEIYEEC